jgi:hypothetical protein
MKNDGLIEGMVLMEVVIRKKLSGAFVLPIIYHSCIHECKIFNEKVLVAVIVDDDNGFFMKLANASITLFPIEIGKFVIYMTNDNESE